METMSVFDLRVLIFGTQSPLGFSSQRLSQTRKSKVEIQKSKMLMV